MNSITHPAMAFGIQISIPQGDPFAQLVGESWTTTHWFLTQAERDRRIKDMQRVHEYSRHSDKPTLVFAPVNRSTDN